MNCPNCGAPLPAPEEDFAVSCNYCSATSVVEFQSLEGLQLLDEIASHDCPMCDTPLTKARCCEVGMAACERCEGMLFPEGTFGIIVQGRRRSYRGPEVFPQPLDPSQVVPERRCPGCRELMQCHPYHGPGNAIIDFCGACNMVWLDSGELTDIERAPGSRK